MSTTTVAAPESVLDPVLGLPLQEQRFAFLAAAGQLLSSSLDYRQTLQHVARLAVPALGDMCIVDVVEDGQLRRVATAHVRDDKSALLRELAQKHPVVDGSPAPAARVMRSGVTELLEQANARDIAETTLDDEHASLIRSLGLRSHVAVPMKARGSVIGVISIGVTESDRRYDVHDKALAEELGVRAAFAVENALLYQAAQDALEKCRQAEDSLGRSERRYRAMMEQSPLSTQILAPDGSTLEVNAAWQALWGLNAEDLAGYNPLEDAQLQAAGIALLLERAFAGEAVHLPVALVDPAISIGQSPSGEARARYVRAIAYPVRDQDGALAEVVLQHEDVSEATHATARLRASDERLQLALSISGVIVWDWDLATDVIVCSDNAREFWGMEVGGAEDFLALILPQDLPAVQEAARTAIENGVEFRLEYRMCSPAGRERWVQSRGRVEYGPEGKPARFLGMTRDFTGQKHAEDATRMLADAGAVLGASLDYQATLSALGEVVIPTFADWFAVDLVSSEGELERVSVAHPDPARVQLAKQLHRDYPPRRDDPGSAWGIIERGEVEWAEEIDPSALEAFAKDAHHLWMLRELELKSYIRLPLVARGTTIGVLTLVFAESGRRYGESDVALAKDLAQRAAVAVDNARLLQELQLADRRKDDFLAMLAHELRNPLAPIGMAAEMLRMSANDRARVIKASGIISRQVAHMTELVDDLLDVSRVTRGLVELEKQPLDLKSVVAGAREQVQSLIELKGHDFVLRTGADPLMVEGDRARLTQVVANLLNNAAKYTPDGGEIELALDRLDGRVRLVVKDNGAGMDRALLPRVFDLFTQAQRTPDRHQGGLGLGLALVKSIVQLHGGEVSAYSRGTNQGSTFTVLLPKAETLEPGDFEVPAEKGEARAPRRILLVDDNEDAAEVLAEVLQLEGHLVRVAHTAADALQIAAREPDIQVFILDIGLPDMTGHELAAALRQGLGDRPALFVALTGYGQAQDREQSSAAGFAHHLVKPAKPQVLLDLLGAG